jgi:hypothetical protein
MPTVLPNLLELGGIERFLLLELAISVDAAPDQSAERNAGRCLDPLGSLGATMTTW